MFKPRKVCPAVLDSPFLRRQKFLNALHRRILGSGSAGGGLVCPSGEQITNGGFETGDFTGWTKTGDCPGKCQIRSLHPHSGSYEAFIQYDWGCGCGIEQTLANETPVECVSAFSVWLYRLAGGAIYILVTYTDDSTTFISQDYGAFVWNQLDMLSDLTVGKTIKSIRFYRYTDGNVWYIDDVTLYC